MNNNRPAKLFKYMPSARFLENSSFRFTQPDALDDHREVLPRLVYGRYAPEDYQIARAKADANGMSDMSDKELETFFLNPYPARRFDEKSFPALWRAHPP